MNAPGGHHGSRTGLYELHAQPRDERGGRLRSRRHVADQRQRVAAARRSGVAARRAGRPRCRPTWRRCEPASSGPGPCCVRSPVPLPRRSRRPTGLAKLAAFRKAAERHRPRRAASRARRSTWPSPTGPNAAGVHQDACTHCGDCVAGLQRRGQDHHPHDLPARRLAPRRPDLHRGVGALLLERAGRALGRAPRAARPRPRALRRTRSVHHRGHRRARRRQPRLDRDPAALGPRGAARCRTGWAGGSPATATCSASATTATDEVDGVGWGDRPRSRAGRSDHHRAGRPARRRPTSTDGPGRRGGRHPRWAGVRHAGGDGGRGRVRRPHRRPDAGRARPSG